MKYFIGYFVTDEAGKYYENLCRDICERFGVLDLAEYIPAHVTIKPPFFLDNIGPLEAATEQVIQTIQPIPMPISGFGRYEVNGKSIFLKVEQSPALIECMNVIATAVDGFGRSKEDSMKPLFPHVSIARHLSPQKAEEVWEYLQTIPSPHFDTSFDNVTLFARPDLSSAWEVKKVFRW